MPEPHSVLRISVVTIALLLLIRWFLMEKRAKISTPQIQAKKAPKEEESLKPPQIFLDKSKKTITLAKVDKISHDTIRMKFSLPSEEMILGLPVGKHFKIFAPNVTGVKPGEWNGRADPDKSDIIERKYTPTSSDHDIGSCELVIKVYEKQPEGRFPDGGKMSSYLGGMKVGDKLTISGPWGLIEYKGYGKFQFMRKSVNYKKIGMIAGGTGITPMLQIIKDILRRADDKTECFLIFANKTEADILLKTELDALMTENPERLKIHYTLDEVSRPDWEGSEGFVTESMIANNFPPASPDTLVLLCGPPPMIKFACKPNLEKLGYKREHIKEF